jgi:hypothetical protein
MARPLPSDAKAWAAFALETGEHAGYTQNLEALMLLFQLGRTKFAIDLFTTQPSMVAIVKGFLQQLCDRRSWWSVAVDGTGPPCSYVRLLSFHSTCWSLAPAVVAAARPQMEVRYCCQACTSLLLAASMTLQRRYKPRRHMIQYAGISPMQPTTRLKHVMLRPTARITLDRHTPST